MANFENQQLTNVGWDALAEALTGKRLLFTRMVAGDGEIESDADLALMTELSNYVQDIPMTSYTADGHGRASITGTLVSARVEQGFFLREVGLMCTVGDDPTEILYCVNNAGDQSDYIPSRDEHTVVVNAIELQIIIGRAENIEVTIEIGDASLSGENIGDPAGAEVFARRATRELQFRRLVGVGGVKAETRGDTVELSVDAGGGDQDLPFVPTGSIMAYVAPNAPHGWLLCNGAAVSRAQHPKLFALIGTGYGIGDGSTTFNVPNLVQRFVLGGPELNTTGGEASHQLTIAELAHHMHNVATFGHAHNVHDPHHTHVMHDPGHGHFANVQTHGINTTAGAFGVGIPGPGGQTTTADGTNTWVHAQATGISMDWQAPTGHTDSIGGNAAHNNMPPFITLNYIIKY